MRVAIYARVSTERQQKEQTINSQIKELEQYAKKKKYTIVKRYIDEGWSGSLLVRPALDELRDDCAKKEFEAVLITCPDRLARKYVYQEIVIEEIKKSGIEVIFLNRPIADTPEDQMLLGMQGLIAEYEREKIKERCRRGKLHKARKGLVIGGIAPYAYRYIKKTTEKDGYYEITQEEAKVVKQMFGLLVNEQMSTRGIAKYLTEHQIPPSKGGNRWVDSTVGGILRNETYAGTTYYNKGYCVETENNGASKYRRNKKNSRRMRPKDQWIPIKVPAIIDRRTWQLAQAQLKRNSELSPRNVKYQYLLQGLVFCGDCGCRYAGIPYNKTLFYRCSNRQRNFPLPPDCKRGCIKGEKLESAVWDSVCEAIKNPKLLMTQIKELRRKRVSRKDVLDGKIRKTESRISKVKNQEDRMLDAYTDGTVTLEQLRGQMDRIRQNKQQLEEEKRRLIEEKNEYGSRAAKETNIKEFCELVEERLDSFGFQEKRKFLKLLIDKVWFEGDCVRIEGAIPVYSDMGKEKNIGNIASIVSW